MRNIYQNFVFFAHFLSAIHLYRNPSTEKLKALFDFVKVLVDFFPKESILMPYLKQLLSARSRITRGRYSCLWSPYTDALPQAAAVCQEQDHQRQLLFPKESILMPYLKQLLSARSRITGGRYSCLRSLHSCPPSKESTLMPALKQLLSARRRTTTGIGIRVYPYSCPSSSSCCLPGVGSPEVGILV